MMAMGQTFCYTNNKNNHSTNSNITNVCSAAGGGLNKCIVINPALASFLKLGFEQIFKQITRVL